MQADTNAWLTELLRGASKQLSTCFKNDAKVSVTCSWTIPSASHSHNYDPTLLLHTSISLSGELQPWIYNHHYVVGSPCMMKGMILVISTYLVPLSPWLVPDPPCRTKATSAFLTRGNEALHSMRMNICAHASSLKAGKWKDALNGEGALVRS